MRRRQRQRRTGKELVNLCSARVHGYCPQRRHCPVLLLSSILRKGYQQAPSAGFDENITDQRQRNSRSTSGTPFASTPSSNPARTRCAQDASVCPGGGLSDSTCEMNAEQIVRNGKCSRVAAGQPSDGRTIRGQFMTIKYEFFPQRFICHFCASSGKKCHVSGAR